MSEWICTDPDAYQWQMLGPFGYDMCQVIQFDGGPYAVLMAVGIAPKEYEDDIDEIASFFGYNPSTLLHNEALFAECIFEYCMDDFVENPYGMSPVYETPEAACKRCDKFMGESHEIDWLREGE